MLSVLAFLLLTAGIVSLAVFLILWLVKALLKSPYSKKMYAIFTSASFALVVLSIILGISTSDPIDRASIDALTERGSEITGLKTSTQVAEEKEKAQVGEMDKKEAVEALKLENEQKEKELAEQKEQEQLAVKEVEEKSANDKVEAEKLAKEQTAKVGAEKKKADEEKNNSVPLKSKKVIYDVFKSGGDTINETVTNIGFDEDEKVLKATVKGKDGWSEKSIGLGFYEDSTAVYRELAKDDRIEEAWLTITFPMQDTYGNTEEEEVMVTYMSRETMDKINWDNFDYRMLLDVADGKRIYPHFTQ